MFFHNILLDHYFTFFVKEDSVLPVIPFTMITEIILKTHLQLAHIGLAKMLDIVSNQYWHPALEKVCRDISVCCLHCQLYKVYSQHIKPPTIRLKTKYPFEIVSMDLMLLPRTSSGNIALLVAVDQFSKWMSIVPLRNKLIG